MGGNKNGTICNYCGLMIKSGRITRFKFHMSHSDPHSNIKKYLNVPPKVKQEMKQFLELKSKAKGKKAANIEEIDLNYEAQWEEDITLSLMRRRKRRVTRMCICIRLTCTPMSEMNIKKQYVYLKASKWNREQVEGFMRGKRKIGKSLNLIHFFT